MTASGITMTNLGDCARDWFATMMEVNRPDDQTDAFIQRASTLTDRESFDEVVKIMIDSGMWMAISMRGPHRIERAMGSSIVTALLLGAHLSKEGYL